MSIAEKLVTVAENQQRVYNAGYEKGKAEGGGGFDYMPYMQTIRFSQTATSEITEDVYLDLSSATSLMGLIDLVNINFNKITVKITNRCTSFQNAFRTNISCADSLEEIEIIGDTSGVTTFYNAFSGRKKLKRIIGILTFGSKVTTIGNMFSNCNSLEEVRFRENCLSLSVSFNASENLTDESVNSIVNAFEDMTGQTAPVLTVHPTVKAKIVADDAKEDTDPTKRYWLKTLTNNNVTLA